MNLPHQDNISSNQEGSVDSEDLEHTARRLFQGLVTPNERKKLQQRLGHDTNFRRTYHKVRRERSLLRNTWTFIKNATRAPFSRSNKSKKFLSPRRFRFLFGFSRLFGSGRKKRKWQASTSPTTLITTKTKEKCDGQHLITLCSCISEGQEV